MFFPGDYMPYKRQDMVAPAENGLARIAVHTPPECGECGACFVFSNSGRVFSAESAFGGKTGGGVFVKTAFFIYLLPCLCFIAGVFIGCSFLPEPLALCFGAVFLFTALFIFKWFHKRETPRAGLVKKT